MATPLVVFAALCVVSSEQTVAKLESVQRVMESAGIFMAWPLPVVISGQIAWRSVYSVPLGHGLGSKYYRVITPDMPQTQPGTITTKWPGPCHPVG